MPALLIFPVRMTYPVISLLFESSQTHCPAELGKNRKDHHKLSLGPCHLPPLQPGKRRARIVGWTKVRGAAGFGAQP